MYCTCTCTRLHVLYTSTVISPGASLTTTISLVPNGPTGISVRLVTIVSKTTLPSESSTTVCRAGGELQGRIVKLNLYPVIVLHKTLSHALLVTHSPIAADACSANCLRVSQVCGAITMGVAVGVLVGVTVVVVGTGQFSLSNMICVSGMTSYGVPSTSRIPCKEIHVP